MTVELLKANFHYAPDSGVLFKVINGALKPCQHMNDKGYLCAYIGNRRVVAHRVAWALMTGKFPVEGLDHIDGDRTNNRWSNLREANPTQNMCNSATKRMEQDLPRGVRRETRRTIPRFLARIQFKKRNISLGIFPTPEEASEVYQLAAEMLHGPFAYHLGQGAMISNKGETK